jgi:uncharacterized protein (DUF1786 family)
MQILTIDIGTGTQDILLFDSERAPENCLKLVMPSPTLLVAQQVRIATAGHLSLVISGPIMGGGPCSWAVEDHRRAGLRVVATEDAARTFNDDLSLVRAEMGVEIVSEAEAARLARQPGFVGIRFGDFDYTTIRQAFAAFGLALSPDALALAVFDHGAAPPDISDRQFRIDYLRDRLGQDRRLSTFAARADDVPPIMTRLRALAASARAQTSLPVVVMDTAPAAVLGALEDPAVASQPDALIVNLGNFHSLAFQFRGGQFVRLFEHHTGLLDPASLAGWLRALADGTITHEAVFADHGHGALCLDYEPIPFGFIAVTGPRRQMAAAMAANAAAALAAGMSGQSAPPVHFAVPHGDQMLAGCFGLLRACADLEPAWGAAIRPALSGQVDRSLW